jgi:hypothetical protein
MDDLQNGNGGTGKPEPDRGSGDPDIGAALTEFFLALLKNGDDLREYYDRSGRDNVINRLVPRTLAADNTTLDDAKRTTAVDLIREGSLRDIEEHILAQGGSYAKPLTIVWPAM